MKDQSLLEFHFVETTEFSINTLKILSWYKSVCEGEHKSLIHLSIVLCSDEFLLKMNREHLAHDYYTDIITFDLSDSNDEIEGELYLSIDRIQENASNQKIDFEQEFHRVLIHGVLHLIGYNDKSSSEQKIMRSKEDAYLSLLNQL